MPSRRVAPTSSPGNSGTGASCEACRPGHRFGYDQRGSPLKAPVSEYGEYGAMPSDCTVQPSANDQAWSPPLLRG